MKIKTAIQRNIRKAKEQVIDFTSDILSYPARAKSKRIIKAADKLFYERRNKRLNK